MGTTLNKQGYEKLIEEDLEWLSKQPECLERGHIEVVLRYSVKMLYPQTNQVEFLDVLKDKALKKRILRHFGNFTCMASSYSTYILEEALEYLNKAVEAKLNKEPLPELPLLTE